MIEKEEPTEEAKQRAKNYMSLKGALEPKQESLEEAAEYYAHNYFDMHETNNYKALKQGFIKGAKWQQEKMYSEEEVKQIIEATLIEYSDFVLADIPEWFEQFKKK
jgi:hypothetical protein